MARGELVSEGEAQAEQTTEDRDAALAAFGLYIEDGAGPAQREPEPFYLWPECVPVFDLWGRMQSQWTVGFNGPTGLNYASVEAWMRMARHPLRRDPDAAEQLRLMERAALGAWAQLRADRATRGK
jgi:hypothetical protein